MKILNFKSISTKLIASFLLISLFAFAFGIFLINSIHKMEANTKQLSEDIPLMSSDYSLLGILTQQQSELRGYLLSGD